jgi:deazaflavin-dependent oxidoreductase (nitroreductase family)
LPRVWYISVLWARSRTTPPTGSVIVRVVAGPREPPGGTGTTAGTSGRCRNEAKEKSCCLTSQPIYDPGYVGGAATRDDIAITDNPRSKELAMAFEKLPSGTRGARMPPGLVKRVMTPLMIRMHRRGRDQFRGNDLLYLTTVGARSGTQRTTPVMRFDDGQGGWLIVASAAGAAQHPGWYHNIAAHPDQVWAEVAGVRERVAVEQLDGDARNGAWERITARAPDFGSYTSKTDRSLPILRLTPSAQDPAET